MLIPIPLIWFWREHGHKPPITAKLEEVRLFATNHVPSFRATMPLTPLTPLMPLMPLTPLIHARHPRRTLMAPRLRLARQDDTVLQSRRTLNILRGHTCVVATYMTLLQTQYIGLQSSSPAAPFDSHLASRISHLRPTVL